ncbi:uncharacterized protein LOC113337331 isoform X2 [Papaver somniferum]|uniref:uncharacterized protein LOC113337331 isoform X2 n=1 Tax=Papaver somniferum TaxID=3469 RepID=UPI000E6F8325|nr:uncharacterized protein LOC113337331 isoform X2 [Papaver somniferum]
MAISVLLKAFTRRGQPSISSSSYEKEKITSGDKHVLKIIVSELKSNGFDFTKDPVALQKIEGAVERAMSRMTNGIKLNLHVPTGEPDISTTISWRKCAGLPILKTLTLPPNTLMVPRLQ